MRVIHIMANGEVKESIEGTVIQSEEFYQILNDIQKRKGEEK